MCLTTQPANTPERHFANVCFGTKRTFQSRSRMSAFGGKADMTIAQRNVSCCPNAYRCFSRRRLSTERPTSAVPNRSIPGGNGFAKVDVEGPDSWSCGAEPSATSIKTALELPMVGVGGPTALSGGACEAAWVGTPASGPSCRSVLSQGPTATGTIKVLVVGLEGVCGCESASKKTVVVSLSVRCASNMDDAPIAFTVSACVLDAAHRKRLTPASKPICFIGTFPE